MTTTLVSQSELDRIKTALFHAGELIALESLVGGAVLPLNVLNILHRLPEIVARIRRLIVDIEIAGQQFFETERRVLGQFADSRLGPMEVLATAAAPLANLALGRNLTWVRRRPYSAEAEAPQGTTTLVERLAAVSKNRVPTIRVDCYGEADGRRFVVYVPGTRHFLGGPLDMRTNVLELAGQQSPVERAVELALAESGAAAGDRVTVVGHSLGGMVAVSLADKSAHGQLPYRVDQVVEVAAPLGRHAPIAGLKLLSIDGTGDLIPLLDGLGKPDWQGASRVLLPEQSLNPVENHEISSYASGLENQQPGQQSWQRFGRLEVRAGSSSFFEFGVSEFP